MFSHGAGLQCTSSTINFWDSQDLRCNSKPISLFLIIALALREHSVIYVKLHSVAQGKNDIEYFQIAEHKTVTEGKKKLLLKNKPWLQYFKIACGNLQLSLSSDLFSKIKLLIYMMHLYEAVWPVNTSSP